MNELNTTTSLHLQHALSQVAYWQKQTRRALAELFPIGSRVKVRLKYDQKELTNATVCALPDYQDGYVRVEIDTAKERSRQKYRNIHHTNVFPAEAQP